MGAIIRGLWVAVDEANEVSSAENHFSVRSAILRVRPLPGFTNAGSPIGARERIDGVSERCEGGVAFGSDGAVGMSDMATRKSDFSFSPASMYSFQLRALNPTEVMIPIDRSLLELGVETGGERRGVSIVI